MTLQELTSRLQTLCHDGWAQNEAQFLTGNMGDKIKFDAKDVELILKSEAAADGVIRIKLDS